MPTSAFFMLAQSSFGRLSNAAMFGRVMSPTVTMKKNAYLRPRLSSEVAKLCGGRGGKPLPGKCCRRTAFPAAPASRPPTVAGEGRG